MKTLFIETGIEEEYENALIASAEKLDWGVVRIMHIPFGEKFVYHSKSAFQKELSEADLNNERGWYHGSITGEVAAKKLTKWQVHAPMEETRCSYYYKALPDVILQNEHRFETIESINTKKDELFASDLVEDGCLFFRPDENDKSFTGGCIHQDDWEEKYKLLTFYDPPLDSVVVVARPQHISAEARFLVVDGKLTTGSYYKTGGQRVRLEASDSLMKEAQRVLDYCLEQNFNPSPSWVLDLAKVEDGWTLIEVGPSSCCGLYKCDTDEFLSALDKVI
jgi:hypothetical protein